MKKGKKTTLNLVNCGAFIFYSVIEFERAFEKQISICEAIQGNQSEVAHVTFSI